MNKILNKLKDQLICNQINTVPRILQRAFITKTNKNKNRIYKKSVKNNR